MTNRTMLAAMLAGAMTASSASTAAAGDLNALRWQKRVLVLFSPAGVSQEDDTFALLRDEAGLAERDLVILDIRGDRLRSLFGTAPSSETAESLRQRFGVEPLANAAFLVGKDGGVKWSTRQPVARDELYRRIDAMPMRRGERKGSHSSEPS